jgi:hypothetical protein
MIGGSNYHGDIAPEIKLKETHLAFGLFYRYNHSSFFSSRYQFTYAKISGDDKNFAANAYRNIKFESNIYELSYRTEFNFKSFGSGGRAYKEGKTSTFVFAGLGIFGFDPKRRLPGGDKVSLRDMGTEGQNLNNKRTYAQIQPAFLMGLGYKVNINQGTVLGIEMGFRKTFTDYLDDTKGQYPDYAAMVAKQGQGAGEFSQPQVLNGNPPIPAGTMRGDSHLNDWYFIVGITISFRAINGTLCPPM